jgi:arginine utilization regulatory protein
VSFDALRTLDIFDGVSYGIILLNNNGCITYANKFARSFAVYSKVEGQQLSYCFPYLVDIDKRKETCIEVKVAKEFYWLRVKRITLAKNKEELITFIDETSQKVLQQENRHQQDKLELYENLLNSIDEGILAVDKYGKILFMNQTQESFDNLSFEKVKGNSMVEHYDLDETTSLLLKIIKTGNKISRQPQYYLTSGKHTVNVVTSCSPIFHKNDIIGAVSISQDFNVTADLVERLHNSMIEDNSINARKGRKVTSVRKKLKNGTRYTFEDIIGKSEPMRDAIENARRAAVTPSNVLIYGETGTGKELFAQSIHNESHQKEQPFIAINCSALPESLLESILFGTVKGAFTGAVDRAGLFEQADGGTLLLDEINSMPLFLQPKLLRVLQEGVLFRIGGNEVISVSPRVISSINVTPQDAIEKKQIRADLYYRLAVVTIAVPSLSERTDDIPVLTDYFINKYNKQFKMNVKHVSNEVMDFFMSYSWPGNVRELENVIEGAMSILREDETAITFKQLPMTLVDFNQNKSQPLPLPDEKAAAKKTSLPKALREKEKNEIMRILQTTSGNISQSARMLGMSRQNLQYKIKRFNIPLEQIRSSSV